MSSYPFNILSTNTANKQKSKNTETDFTTHDPFLGVELLSVMCNLSSPLSLSLSALRYAIADME